MLMKLVQGKSNMVRNDFYINELVYQLKTKNRLFRIAIFIWGVLIYAISFSLFFSPNNIVSGGSTGLSLIVKEGLKQIDENIFFLACDAYEVSARGK